MGMYTWLSESEFERYSKVSHEELNELFQEVRELMPDIYIDERFRVKTRWLKKNEEVLDFYSVYHKQRNSKGRGTEEVRCINLRFNSHELLYNYLCGLINGYNALERYHASENKNNLQIR